MASSLSVSAIILFLGIGLAGLATAANTAEPAPSPVGKPDAVRVQTSDCAQQVWPHLSAECLRNADSKVDVRLVTITRR